MCIYQEWLHQVARLSKYVVKRDGSQPDSRYEKPNIVFSMNFDSNKFDMELYSFTKLNQQLVRLHKKKNMLKDAYYQIFELL